MKRHKAGNTFQANKVMNHLGSTQCTFNPFNIQSVFTAMHGIVHDFMNLKQEFEQIRLFKKTK